MLHSLVSSIHDFFFSNPTWMSLIMAILGIIIYLGAGRTLVFFFEYLMLSLKNLIEERMVVAEKKEKQEEKNDGKTVIISAITIYIAWPAILAMVLLIIAFAISLILAIIGAAIILLVTIIQFIAQILSGLIIIVPPLAVSIIILLIAIIIVFLFASFILISAYNGLDFLAFKLPTKIIKNLRKK
jgi:hypothetical protein